MGKKSKVQQPIVISCFEYPSYFVGYACNLDIDISDYVDGYAYHDFPNSVHISMQINDLIALRSQIDEAIEKAQTIYEKYKDRKPANAKM